ncbi:hypothetical protein RHGRI_024540 [Rhododendron griersonianum]|uniref:Uncharacterized protein n=1 Tax=Rhododendron griersonianum TaxID=479676 RepID=A0AAV6J9T4_9ERIC|nr:hypothetical protein RHGRI_024540 [Rhododendron griersonianum]
MNKNKVASFNAIKVSKLKQMEFLRKLKNHYGFEGTVLISKYVSYSERENIKDLADLNGENPIDFDEEEPSVSEI